MKHYAWLIFLTLFALYLASALLTGCTLEQIQAIEDAAMKAPAVEALVPEVTQEEAMRLPKLDWGDRPSWTKATVEALKKELPNFEKAKDIKRFCPAWKELLPGQKITALSHLVVEVVKFESAFNPSSKYQEPKPPHGPGTLSQGLLQLSVGDSAYGGTCAGITMASLYDPIVNLECGIHMMGRLVARDGVLQNSSNRGMARYWSVIRDGHHVDEIAYDVSRLEVCR